MIYDYKNPLRIVIDIVQNQLWGVIYENIKIIFTYDKSIVNYNFSIKNYNTSYLFQLIITLIT